MTTHGRILVRKDSEENKPREGLILYAWSDGHTHEAVKDIMSLPFTLFERSIDRANNSNKHIGPWYYQMFMSFATESERDSNCKRWNEGEFSEKWEFLNRIHLHYAGVANWITFIHFDRWTVVPNLEYCSYPNDLPDIIVDVSEDEDEGEYFIHMPDDETSKDILEEIAPTISELNGQIENKQFHITVANNKICVPFMGITKMLMWQAIQRKYKELDVSKEKE